MTTGNKLRIARKEANYSLPDAARELGLSRSRYQMYEMGELPIPAVHALQMAKLFRLEADAFCDDGGIFLKIPVKLDGGALAPRKKSSGAGFEIFTPKSVFLRAGERRTLETGIRLGIPTGYCAVIVSNPNLRQRFGIFADGLYEDKSGCLTLTLSNFSPNACLIPEGDRIAEFYILPCALSVLDAPPVQKLTRPGQTM